MSDRSNATPGRWHKAPLAAAAAACFFTGAISLPAHALTIIPNFVAAYDSFQQATVNSAISMFESRFSDNVTVNINFGLTGGLGSSSQFIYGLGYNTFYNALAADRTSTNDYTAVSSLAGGSSDPYTGAQFVYVTLAQCGALGLNCVPNPAAGGVNGTIGINLGLVDANRADGISAGSYDMLSVVEHEINEILGMGGAASGVGSGYLGVLDLFRYTAAGARTYTTAGDNAYFSIDGGATHLARFNQNSGGDYADWWSVGAHTAQVQDAFGTPGVLINYGTAETTALDVVGYNLVTSVPEPATYAMMMAGLGLLAVFARRRKQQLA